MKWKSILDPSLQGFPDTSWRRALVYRSVSAHFRLRSERSRHTTGKYWAQGFRQGDGPSLNGKQKCTAMEFDLKPLELTS